MYYNKKTDVYLDGKWIKADNAKTDLYSQTLHYGSGVFEGIRSYKTEDGVLVFKAREHFERLKSSAEKMHINFEYAIDDLVELTYELLERNNLENAYIRPLVYLDANMKLEPTKNSHFMLCAWEWGKYLGDEQLKIMTSSFERPNPKSCFIDAKVTGHYTNSILATTEAKNKGFDEALLMDMNGFVAEGSGANFFYEKDEKLYTAPLGQIYPGVTRQTIIEIAGELGIEVEEKLFTKEDVYLADGAFFTGTAAEVAGIESLDGKKFNLNWEDTLGKTLSAAYLFKVQKREYKNYLLL